MSLVDATSRRRRDGLAKEYKASQTHINKFRTTSAMEMTLARNVEQMFNDKEILKYLRK